MLKIGTIFTGIGAFEEALNQLKIEYKVLFASDNGERVLSGESEKIICENPQQQIIINEYEKIRPNFVKRTYIENFGKHLGDWYEDVRFLDAKKYDGDLDILVGGSPCQAFSSIGKRKGLDDARGTLFFEYARIVSESHPKYFIYENVPGIKTVDNGKTWERIKEIFDNLNYNIQILDLNSVDFGLPQRRRRFFFVGKRKDIGPFSEINLNNKKPKPISDFLIDNADIPEKYFMGKKGFEFVTNPKYSGRATIDREILRTLKATQQYNWNGNFIFYETNKFKNHEKIYTSFYNGKEGVIRKMLPYELLWLMGFSKEYKLPDNPDKELYRHSGNSIAVPILKEIIKGVLYEK